MRRRVLIAEDDPGVRRLVKTILSGRGRELVLTEDGKVAYAAWQGGAFSLLVLDDHMPGWTGTEVIRQVRATGGKTPAILMSAALGEEVVLWAEAMGGVKCLQKPFAVAELRHAVDDFLARPAWTPDLRLGSLALRSGALTSAQLVTVLAIQSFEASSGRPAKRLGHVCLVKGFLSKERLDALLQEQSALRTGPG